MFSVIIPLHNKSPYVLKAIKSVLGQTFDEFELIVVNDGSTDDGPKKVRLIKDERLTIIDQQNFGVSTARNNGVKVAQYDYIAFLDADDWWDKHFLEEMKRLIEIYPNAGIYGCNYYYFKNGTRRVDDKGLEEEFTAGYIDYFRVYAKTFCVPFNCSFVTVDKKAFNQVDGFSPRLKFGEDFDLWVRIALQRRVAYLNKPLAYSNQDVVSQNRALGFEKLYKKNECFIFNSGYLKEQEKQNPDLKVLLDGLRVKALLRYHLNKIYTQEVKTILSMVDFNQQSVFYRLMYGLPIPLIKLYFIFMRAGSMVKQIIIKTLSAISRKHSCTGGAQ